MASHVIGQPHTAPLAAFGGYAILAPADFGGRPEVRLLAYPTLVIAGAVLAPLRPGHRNPSLTSASLT